MIKICCVPMKIHKVEFKGDIVTKRDIGGSPYTGADWQDDDMDGQSDLTNANADSSTLYHPIAYKSTDCFRATVHFRPDGKKSDGETLLDGYDVEADVRKVKFRLMV